jgi:hypothetical protein
MITTRLSIVDVVKMMTSYISSEQEVSQVNDRNMTTHPAHNNITTNTHTEYNKSHRKREIPPKISQNQRYFSRSEKRGNILHEVGHLPVLWQTGGFQRFDHRGHKFRQLRHRQVGQYHCVSVADKHFLAVYEM